MGLRSWEFRGPKVFWHRGVLHDKFEITLVLLIKKIRELVDGIGGRIRLGIKILDVLEGPAELSKVGLVRIGIEIISLTEISSVLVIALSGASVVSTGEDQEANECKEEDILLHKKLNK